ncbi:hypothetical protein M422DRAFT_56575 [Sphaerobolus stellatus SS14]|uniref:Uncharacterized protein n=1 Tax=Sphaerobolus stellatus (strain SS14) TaxID=990650 RepID=A0A0C9UFR4_SPHS4|nr:hypothetical protein M422DRAFT_56575 [Sphaerobolus stellatus SS14]
MVEGIINERGAVLLSGSSVLETLRPIKGVSQLATRGVDGGGSAKPAIAIVESTAGCPPSPKAAVATVSNVGNPVEHDSQPAAKPAMAIIESTAGQPPVLLAAIAAASDVAPPVKHGGGIISLSDAVKEATEDASLVVITQEVTLTARRPRKPASTMGLAGVKSEALTAKAEGEKTTNEKKATKTESKKTPAKSAKNGDKKSEDPPTMRTTRGRKGKGTYRGNVGLPQRSIGGMFIEGGIASTGAFYRHCIGVYAMLVIPDALPCAFPVTKVEGDVLSLSKPATSASTTSIYRHQVYPNPLGALTIRYLRQVYHNPLDALTIRYLCNVYRNKLDCLDYPYLQEVWYYQSLAGSVMNDQYLQRPGFSHVPGCLYPTRPLSVGTMFIAGTFICKYGVYLSVLALRQQPVSSESHD